MIISGLSKLTLLDYPGKTACTVFTHGCNIRCPFCHNSPLVTERPQDTLSEDEIFAFLKKRKNILEGVCITGGEPLLHPDLGDFIGKIKDLGYPVKLDTNGTFPDRLSHLIDRGLVDRVAMDIKNSPERYPQTVGIEGFDITPIRQSVELLLAGKVEYEFRTTVVKELHDDESILGIGRFISGAKCMFLQKFTDSGNTIKKGLSAPENGEITRFAELLRPFAQEIGVRGI